MILLIGAWGTNRRNFNPEDTMDIIVAMVIWATVFAVMRLGYLD